MQVPIFSGSHIKLNYPVTKTSLIDTYISHKPIPSLKDKEKFWLKLLGKSGLLWKDYLHSFLDLVEFCISSLSKTT